MQMLVQRIDCGRNSNGHKNRVVPSSCSLHYNNHLLGTCPHYYRLRARILRFLVQKKDVRQKDSHLAAYFLWYTKRRIKVDRNIFQSFLNKILYDFIYFLDFFLLKKKILFVNSNLKIPRYFLSNSRSISKKTGFSRGCSIVQLFFFIDFETFLKLTRSS